MVRLYSSTNSRLSAQDLHQGGLSVEVHDYRPGGAEKPYSVELKESPETLYTELSNRLSENKRKWSADIQNEIEAKILVLKDSPML
jgi:hypothetical protein